MQKKQIEIVLNELSCQRDGSFDVLKGLGIFFMIWVHCKTSAISHFAYTFHMPLFLFISGYFYKIRNLKQEVSLDLQRIIVPYVFTCIVMIVLSFSFFDLLLEKNVMKTALFSSLWGGAVFGSLFGYFDLFIGPLWFLLGLFWTRLLFCILLRFVKNDFICGTVIFMLAIIAKCFFEVFGHVPLSFLQAFGCMGFFYMGYLARRYDLLSMEKLKRLFPFCILCWLYCMTFSRLALHACTYEGFYILDILGAWGAFCVFYVLVKNIYNKENWFWKIMEFVGRNSIIVLCVHAVDHCLLNRWTPLSSQLAIVVGDIPVTFFRLVLAVSLAYLLTKNKFIYERIFCMKKR